MMKQKKCAKCGAQFEGESWKTHCLKCYVAKKKREQRKAQREEGARIAADIDARRSEVRKAKRRLKVVVPDRTRQEEE